MASFRKMAAGKWRAEIAKAGIRKSKVLPSKQAAKDWAARQEYLIAEKAEAGDNPRLADVFLRYGRDVSRDKRGARWEVIRLNRFCTYDLANMNIRDVKAKHIAAWRDMRLRSVKPASVNREMVLMSAVFTKARKEWGLVDASPMSDVSKPPKPPGRDRLVTEGELARLAVSAGDDLGNKTARAFHAFLFAIETAMRAGEIVGLTWAHIDLSKRVVTLPMTKNGTSRKVPLSSRAVALLEALPSVSEGQGVFGLTSSQLSSLWRKVAKRAAVNDLTFHDSRHCGITRLADKLEVLELARMVGHRNINMLLTYYNKTAEDLAKKLD